MEKKPQNHEMVAVISTPDQQLPATHALPQSSIKPEDPEDSDPKSVLEGCPKNTAAGKCESVVTKERFHPIQENANPRNQPRSWEQQIVDAQSDESSDKNPKTDCKELLEIPADKEQDWPQLTENDTSNPMLKAHKPGANYAEDYMGTEQEFRDVNNPEELALQSRGNDEQSPNDYLSSVTSVNAPGYTPLSDNQSGRGLNLKEDCKERPGTVKHTDHVDSGPHEMLYEVMQFIPREYSDEPELTDSTPSTLMMDDTVLEGLDLREDENVTQDPDFLDTHPSSLSGPTALHYLLNVSGYERVADI